MREVNYLGGIARFRLPETWEIEMSVEDGGCFWDPRSEATLRLNTLTFDTSAGAGQAKVRHRMKAGQRTIDGGTLPNGCAFDVYEVDAEEDGEPIRIRYWQIVQVLQGLCRIYVFSYTFAVTAQHAVASDITLVDKEIRRMVPHREPV